MARHKFDGVWRCFLMPNVFGSEPPDDPVELDIRKGTNSNGSLDSGSKLQGRNITGRITGKRLEFEHPDGGGVKKYRGKHFLDLLDASGQPRLVMAGLFIKEEVEPAAPKKKSRIKAPAGQEDGIWIVVKP